MFDTVFSAKLASIMIVNVIGPVIGDETENFIFYRKGMQALGCWIVFNNKISYNIVLCLIKFSLLNWLLNKQKRMVGVPWCSLITKCIHLISQWCRALPDHTFKRMLLDIWVSSIIKTNWPQEDKKKENIKWSFSFLVFCSMQAIKPTCWERLNIGKFVWNTMKVDIILENLKKKMSSGWCSTILLLG